ERTKVEHMSSQTSASHQQPVKVALVGATGKMGRYAVDAINDADDMELVATLSSKNPLDDISASGASHVLDLTVPDVSPQVVSFAIAHGLHTVIGTSGWTEEKRARLETQLAEHPDI